MLICFDSSAEAKRALDELLETKEFRDVSEAVCMALVNYQAMHRTIGKSGAVIGEPVKPKPTFSQPVQEGVVGTSQLSLGKSGPASWKEAMEPFTLAVSTLDEIETIPVRETQKRGGNNLPPKDWLFGQLNRFLPAKATCRALLNLERQNPKGVLVSEASSRIAFSACRLGDYLRHLDKLFTFNRDCSLAAAFPSTEYHGAESRVRFGNQFVGNIKQGQLTGLPAGIGLLAYDTSKDPRLVLTQAGAQFALLPNPLLDDLANPGRETLNEVEIRFLLGHVKNHVPAELSAYVALIDAIKEKANTPEKLDEYLRRRFNLQLVEKADPNKPEQITKTFLSTQRTGAVSRMADLKLIWREKKGLKVSYTVSHPGEVFRSEIQ